MEWDKIEAKWAEMVVRVQPNIAARAAPPAPARAAPTAAKLPQPPKAEQAKGATA